MPNIIAEVPYNDEEEIPRPRLAGDVQLAMAMDWNNVSEGHYPEIPYLTPDWVTAPTGRFWVIHTGLDSPSPENIYFEFSPAISEESITFRINILQLFDNVRDRLYDYGTQLPSARIPSDENRVTAGRYPNCPYDEDPGDSWLPPERIADSAMHNVAPYLTDATRGYLEIMLFGMVPHGRLQFYDVFVDDVDNELFVKFRFDDSFRPECYFEFIIPWKEISNFLAAYFPSLILYTGNRHFTV